MKNKEAKKRFYQLLKSFGVILGICILYFNILVPYTTFRIHCPVYKLTGLYCPGCGITRMLLALMKFDFLTAFQHNMLLFCLLPFLLFFMAKSAVQYILNGENKPSVAEQIFYIIAFVLAIAFTILRNMPQFDFLAP